MAPIPSTMILSTMSMTWVKVRCGVMVRVRVDCLGYGYLTCHITSYSFSHFRTIDRACMLVVLEIMLTASSFFAFAFQVIDEVL